MILSYPMQWLKNWWTLVISIVKCMKNCFITCQLSLLFIYLNMQGQNKHLEIKKIKKKSKTYMVMKCFHTIKETLKIPENNRSMGVFEFVLNHFCLIWSKVWTPLTKPSPPRRTKVSFQVTMQGPKFGSTSGVGHLNLKRQF